MELEEMLSIAQDIAYLNKKSEELPLFTQFYYTQKEIQYRQKIEERYGKKPEYTLNAINCAYEDALNFKKQSFWTKCKMFYGV